jgi:hypothetical protein
MHWAALIGDPICHARAAHPQSPSGPDGALARTPRGGSGRGGAPERQNARAAGAAGSPAFSHRGHSLKGHAIARASG